MGETATSSSTSWRGVAFQLLLSHMLASGAVLSTFLALASSGLDSLSLVLLSIMIGGVVGSLLTIWLQYNLYIVELALGRFARGQPVEMVPGNGRRVGHWPLTTLFHSLHQMDERLKNFAQGEQLAQDYRERVLRQTGEAAALQERNRIARDLHDSIKQQIFSISMSAAAAKAHWNGSSTDAREAVEDIQRCVKEAQVEMQALLQQLHSAPLENTSLVEALHTQAQALSFRTGAQVKVEIAGLPDSDLLPLGTLEMIFRIVQETFANISRHARASIVELRAYQQEQALYVEIEDDGQGFDLATVRKGMGLTNLQERTKTLQGTVEIESAVGKGTKVHVRIPLLVPLRNQQEMERSRHEIAHAQEQARWGFQLSDNASLITVGLLLLLTISAIPGPFFSNSSMVLVTGPGLLTALYGYVHGRYYSTRVALNAGEGALETLSLQERIHETHLWFTRILLAEAWFLFLLWQDWRTPVGWWLVLTVSLLLFVAILVERQILYRMLNRYYKLLPEVETRWQVRQRVNRSVSRMRLWLLLFGLIVLNWIRGGIFVFPPRAPVEWSVYAETLGLLGWGAIALIGYNQARHWQQIWQKEKSNDEGSYDGEN